MNWENVPGAGNPPDLIEHGEDLDWIFGYQNTPCELTMLTYFRNFAVTLNPNGPGLPTWPLYELNSDTAFKVIDGGYEAMPYYRYSACQFWDSYHAVNGFNSKLFPIIKPVPNLPTDPVSVGYEAGGPIWQSQGSRPGDQQPHGKSHSKPQSQAHSQAHRKPQSEPQSKAHRKPQSEPQSKARRKSHSKPLREPQSKAHRKSHSKPPREPQSKAHGKPDSASLLS